MSRVSTIGEKGACLLADHALVSVGQIWIWCMCAPVMVRMRHRSSSWLGASVRRRKSPCVEEERSERRIYL